MVDMRHLLHLVEALEPDIRQKYIDAVYAALDSSGARVRVDLDTEGLNSYYSDHPMVRLNYIEVLSRRRNQGLGSTVMTMLTRLADEMGIAIVLRAASGRNEDFYFNFGFEGSGRMIREPRSIATVD
jgi:GNAT superfamily N-acetyltransferase